MFGFLVFLCKQQRNIFPITFLIHVVLFKTATLPSSKDNQTYGFLYVLESDDEGGVFSRSPDCLQALEYMADSRRDTNMWI
jgi:hypothetical protein